MNLQIACVITADKKAKIVYTIAKTKKLASNTAKVTIKKIAKNVAATKIGHFKIFCKTIASIIVATGSAKNSNKISICQSGNIQNISISCYALPYFNRFMIEIRTFTDKLSDITTFDMITL